MVKDGVLKIMDRLTKMAINYYGVKKLMINVLVNFKNVLGVDKKFLNLFYNVLIINIVVMIVFLIGTNKKSNYLFHIVQYYKLKMYHNYRILGSSWASMNSLFLGC
jgi:hypothetical protein